MFSFVKPDDVEQVKETVCFNTDSLYDLMTGDVRRGFDGKWYINGGLGPACAGFLGRSGMFKSTLASSLAMRMCAVYDTQMILFDSEDAITRSIDRIIRMSGEHSDKINDEYLIALDAKNKYDLDETLKMIDDFGKKKLAMGKDAYITTPFLDRKTDERMKVLRPTPIFIDSLTELRSDAEAKLMEKGIDDPKNNTVYMLDANKKTIWMREVCRYAAKYGFEIILTAHYDQKLNMESYLPPPKRLQFMGQNEAAKGVGSKFYFLTSPQVLINSCTLVQDDAKQCKYKLNSQTPSTELSELMIKIQRCKNNNSGVMHPFIVSQQDGLLATVSDYNYLRSSKAYGFSGNNVNHQCVFYPETSMTRNSFRGICEKDPRLTRALQLAAQLCYIQNNWSDAGWSFPLKIVDPKALCDFLYSDKNKMSVDRVLESRGYWLPDETKSDKEYMSIFDVLEFCSQNNLVKQ